MADGDFTNSTGIILPVTNVTTGENEVHDPWPSVTPGSPRSLIEAKFDATMQLADDMMVRLVGVDGNSGYLGALNDIIDTYSSPVLDDIVVDIITSTTSVPARPLPDSLDNLNIDFGTFDETAPLMQALPAIDASAALPGTAPIAPVGATISWSESSLSPDIYNTLLARILADMVSGSTGLNPIVEQETYDRAVDRQLTANDKMYREIEDYFSSRGFIMPTGAMAGRLQEAATEILRANADINGKVMIEQAELAQKNSQFIIQQSVDLEKLIRATRDGESLRALDKEKAAADLIIQLYAESVKAYLADAEAKKAYVEAQVEVLRGTVEHNKGLVDIYRANAEVFKTTVEAKTSANQGIIEGFKAEVIGYEAETRALSANQSAQSDDNKIRLGVAELELRKQIAQIEATISAYGSESSLKEKISNDMAQIAAQAVASALNAVNASASYGYSGSESRSESYGHSESISESHGFSSSVSESHDYQHDPAV